MNDEQRLTQANEILRLYAPHVTLFRRNGRLWLRYERHYSCEKAAVLNSSGSCLACRYGDLGMGGTSAAATAMLVRWIRDEHRYSIKTWEYWIGENVKLGRDRGPELLAMLRVTDYGDPAKTGCTRCGRNLDDRSPGDHWDWYSGPGRVTGMQCGSDECKRKQP